MSVLSASSVLVGAEDLLSYTWCGLAQFGSHSGSVATNAASARLLETNHLATGAFGTSRNNDCAFRSRIAST